MARDFDSPEAKLRDNPPQGPVTPRRIEDTYDVVAMTDKKHEPSVIKELKKLYG
ncbi:hypothetical protein [Streptomyces lavendulae]|uniref:hypothetical protein n=1 Tax=Streptomyces lavendulae TaxID=1914 RepID=UPI0036E74B74